MRALLNGGCLLVTAFGAFAAPILALLVAQECEWPMAMVVSIGLVASGLVAIAGMFAHGSLDRFLYAPRGLMDSVDDLRARGLLDSRRFLITRALEVEECEDEGLHYFLEVAEGGVLYLTGQYLYDYLELSEAEAEELGTSAHPRLFPCTDFVVHRHVGEGYVVELECLGSPLAPEETLDNELLPAMLEIAGVQQGDWPEVSFSASAKLERPS